ncbi:MAG: hypothetical protein HOI95_15470 [Chromatiales bacterium]|nr:hypothetical protein [Chromatiales bacterium]
MAQSAMASRLLRARPRTRPICLDANADLNPYNTTMVIRLPPSLDRTRHTVSVEVGWARGLSVEQRLDAVALACRAAAKVAALKRDLRSHLARRDPYPDSTVAALRRMRV